MFRATRILGVTGGMAATAAAIAPQRGAVQSGFELAIFFLFSLSFFFFSFFFLSLGRHEVSGMAGIS